MKMRAASSHVLLSSHMIDRRMKICMAYVQESRDHTKTRGNPLEGQNSILKYIWLPQVSFEGDSVD